MRFNYETEAAEILEHVLGIEQEALEEAARIINESGRGASVSKALNDFIEEGGDLCGCDVVGIALDYIKKHSKGV